METKKINGIFIDTTNEYLIVGFLFNKEVEIFEKIKANKNLTSITNEVIDNLLNKNNINVKDIKEAYVTTGPGSYTGVRIGVTIIKTWNEIYKFDNVYSINGLDLLSSKDKTSIIDARGNKFYCLDNNKIILKDNEELKKLKTITYNDINKQNLVDNINNFKKVDINKLEPLYIKKVI